MVSRCFTALGPGQFVVIVETTNLSLYQQMSRQMENVR